MKCLKLRIKPQVSQVLLWNCGQYLFIPQHRHAVKQGCSVEMRYEEQQRDQFQFVPGGSNWMECLKDLVRSSQEACQWLDLNLHEYTKSMSISKF